MDTNGKIVARMAGKVPLRQECTVHRVPRESSGNEVESTHNDDRTQDLLRGDRNPREPLEYENSPDRANLERMVNLLVKVTQKTIHRNVDRESKVKN